MKQINKVLLTVLVFGLLFLSACGARYVCHDGTVERREDRCPVFEHPRTIERQANNAVDVHGRVYADALGMRFSRVNTYRVGADWHVNVLFSDPQKGIVNQVIFKVDGVNSNVECFEGCEHLKTSVDEEINQSLEDLNLSEDDYEGSGISLY